MLEQVNVVQHRRKEVSGLSGGMRQRFGIAQALMGNADLHIVDETNEGLDPEERNRFHNLLVTLGEDKVIILSTHIVDDVSELCADMAVLGAGEILLQGNPIEVTNNLAGKIWRKIVSMDEAKEIEANMALISKRLFAGRTVVHVMANTSPEGFESAPANLEDVYFSTLHQQRTSAI